MGDDELWYNMGKYDMNWSILDPFPFAYFRGGPIFGKCPKTENKPWAYFWCLKILKIFGHFPKISPEFILSKPRYTAYWLDINIVAKNYKTEREKERERERERERYMIVKLKLTRFLMQSFGDTPNIWPCFVHYDWLSVHVLHSSYY